MKQVARFLYQLLPFKRQVFQLVKKIAVPSESLYRHLHFSSPFTVKLPDGQTFRLYNGTRIENEIFWEGITGHWEKESMKLWIQLSERSNVFLDIGANNGVYALVAQSINREAEVHAFEPHPEIFQTLRRNILLNSFPIQAHQLGVSDRNSDLDLPDYSGKEENIQARTIALDDFLPVDHKIDLVKIDVEGHEIQVLDGMSRIIRNDLPTILIEVLSQEIAEQIAIRVAGLNYLYFNINEDGGVRKTPTIEVSDSYNYLICREEVAKYLKLL